MELRPHQLKTVQEAKDMWGLWFRQRVGKSPTAIRLATSRTESALIICPKSLTTHWEKEIELWKDNTACHFEVISRDQFMRKYNSIPAKQALIIDECHRGVGNYKSKLYKAVDTYIKDHNVKYLWLLSGTPMTASSWSVYSYGKLMLKKWNWFNWDKTFFTKLKIGNRSIPIAKKGMDSKLQDILRSIGTVIDLKDVSDVVDDEEIVEEFELNSTQKKYINDLNDVLPIVRYNHINQLESGVLKSDGYSEALSFECDKDSRLLELVEENDKIVIVARYLQQIEKYIALFKECNRPMFIIKGGTKQTASEIAVQAEQADKAIVLIQSDTCEGYSLKSFDVMVFTSLSYSFVSLDQMKFRIKAVEKNTPNTYIYFLTKGKSIDKAVYDCVSCKQDFSTTFYNHASRRS